MTNQHHSHILLLLKQRIQSHLPRLIPLMSLLLLVMALLVAYHLPHEIPSWSWFLQHPVLLLSLLITLVILALSIHWLQEDLLVNERRFRQLFENAPIGMVIVDRGRRLIQVNQAMCDFVGYAESDLLGKTFDQITHPDDLGRNLEQFQHAYQHPSARGYHLRKRYLHRDGHLLWGNLYSCPIRASNGEPLYSIGLVEDITARINSEQQRLAHETQQRDALVREVHHRIKNNLHGVIGLLRQHISSYPLASVPLEAAIAQIHTISVIHGLHSRLGDHEARPAELLRAIVQAATSLAGATGSPSLTIDDVDDLCIHHHALVAVALILNELLQNAFKHGRLQHTAELQIHLQRSEDGLAIAIENRGEPLPEGFNLSSGVGCGIGLDLVRTLLPDRGARLEILQRQGLITATLNLLPPLVSPAVHCCQATTDDGLGGGADAG